MLYLAHLLQLKRLQVVVYRVHIALPKSRGFSNLLGNIVDIRSPADTRAYVERIERRLQTKVSLHPNAEGGGKIEINYFNLEDLERIGAMLLGESQ